MNDRLAAALRSVRTPRVRFPDDSDWPVTLQPGEIRAARSMDLHDSVTRLVLVLDVSESPDPWANTCLLEAFVETMTDRDVRLTPSDTGLSFTLVAETDVVGPVFAAQLGPRLGVLSHSFLVAIAAAIHGDPAPALEGRTGLPPSLHDHRWQHKRSELATMHGLGRDCLNHLLEQGSEARSTVIVDPGFLGLEAQAFVTRFVQVMSSVEKMRPKSVDFPLEFSSIVRFNEQLGDLSSDHIRMLQPLIDATLTSSAAMSGPAQAGVDWVTPWPGVGSIALAQDIARRRVDYGVRAVRVVTATTQLGREMQGVLALDIRGHGRVQVTAAELD